MEEKVKQMSELLKVLANENRLLIFCALIHKPMTVSDIGKRIPNISQSALSQHLSLLKAHGILNYQKIGQSIIYSIADYRVIKLMNTLYEYY
ncbi:MAG: metalloregulator ArsR/SmtB family transcription factor [Lachnoclostridium sp.]|jgi:DNA-binding transcriptional ArsR family regulator|nr:metalloregulator ArsR/SmtB family transcription factor [Lachnoclostridium sp.]